MYKKKSLLFGAGILAFSVILSLATLVARSELQPWIPLVNRVPLVVEGWAAKDLPLGATESIIAAVGSLRYDDYIYRVYRRGNQEIFIYAMFWRQGRISIREMAGHTPDGCWVANGAMPDASPQTQVFSLGGRSTAPAECRIFTFPGGAVAQVAWWHVWGTELVPRTYAEKGVRPMIHEVWAWLGRRSGQTADQLFVRIHSSGPIEEALQSAPALAFVAALPQVFSAKVR